MANNKAVFQEIEKQVKNLEKNIANKVAPNINKLFIRSVERAIQNWYNDYSPRYYIRTGNFMNVVKSAKTRGNGNILRMSVDSGYMDNYHGWYGYSFGNTYNITPRKISTFNGQKLNSSMAFDFMFVQGEHGHGDLLAHKSIPPYLYVERDIEDGFGGRAWKIIDKQMKNILFK